MSELPNSSNNRLAINFFDHSLQIQKVYEDFSPMEHKDPLISYVNSLHTKYRDTAIYGHVHETALGLTKYSRGINTTLEYRNGNNEGMHYLNGAVFGIHFGEKFLMRYFDENLCDMHEEYSQPTIDIMQPRNFNHTILTSTLYYGVTNLDRFFGISDEPGSSRYYVEQILKDLNILDYRAEYFRAGLGNMLGLISLAEDQVYREIAEKIQYLDFKV